MAKKTSGFIERLQWLMRYKKISQKALAKASSLAPATFSRWKNKGLAPDEKSIQKIADATGCNFYWLKNDDYQGPVWERERWAFETGDVTMTPQEIAGFYERIDEIITALNINKQKLLAIANQGTGVHNSQNRYFLGAPPGSITINEIAIATGYRPDWLLTGKGRRLAQKAYVATGKEGGESIIKSGTQETSEILKSFQKVTERNVHLRQIIDWMDAEFGQKDEQALFFYEDLKDRYPSFAEFMEKKRPGGSGLATDT